MEEKRKRKKIPHQSSIRTALIHVNGVSEELEWTDYFDAIIDFGQLLTPST